MRDEACLMLMLERVLFLHTPSRLEWSSTVGVVRVLEPKRRRGRKWDSEGVEKEKGGIGGLVVESEWKRQGRSRERERKGMKKWLNCRGGRERERERGRSEWMESGGG